MDGSVAGEERVSISDSGAPRDGVRLQQIGGTAAGSPSPGRQPIS